MNGVFGFFEILYPYFRITPPVLGLPAIVTLGVLNYKMQAYADEKVSNSTNFSEIERYEKCKSRSKYGMATIVSIVVLYVPSSAGFHTIELNSLMVFAGSIWAFLTISSIFLQ